MNSRKKVVNETNEITTEKKTSVISRELEKIAVKNLGTITPTIVVDEAKNSAHPLHGHFEWNDKVAGHRFRLNQARSMIIAQKFTCQLKEANENKAVIEVTKKNVRKYLPDHEGQERFLPRAEVLSEEEHRKIIVERKLSVLRSWCDSVIDIDELSTIRSTIVLLVI